MNPFTDRSLNERIVYAQRTASETYDLWDRSSRTGDNAALTSVVIDEHLFAAGLINRAVIGGLRNLKDKIRSDVAPAAQRDLLDMVNAISARAEEAAEAQVRTTGARTLLASYLQKARDSEALDMRQAKRPRVETELPADYPQVKTDMEYPVDKGTQTDAPSPAEAPTSLAETWLASLA